MVAPARPLGSVRYQATVNGRLCDLAAATIPATDDGLLRGDGCFEYLRVYLGRPFLLSDHLDRMERSCQVLRLSFPRPSVEADVAALLGAMCAADQADVSFDMRIVLTRGGNRLVLAQPLLTTLDVAALALVSDLPRPCLAGAKTISYAANMLAQRLARERGFDEALLVAPDGRVLEAQTGSVFWVSDDGALCTPPLSEGILDSITRRLLRERLAVAERSCRVGDLEAASEVFIAASSWEVRPVGRIEERELDAAPGAVTRAALKAMWAALEAHTGRDLAPHFAQADSPAFVLAAWRELHSVAQ
jgi:branched-chain amino acid aminotransferase